MLRVNKYFNKIDKFLSICSGIALFIMMIWIFLDVFFRFVFKTPIKGTLEITGEYLMVILVYFSISYTLKKQKHVKVDLVEGKLPLIIKNVTTVLTNLLAATIFTFIGVYNLKEGLRYFEENIVSLSILKYPLAPALIIISIGIFMLVIRLLLQSLMIVFSKEEEHQTTIEDGV